MRVDIIGGGPAGLLLAYLLRRDGVADDVRVFERYGPESTYGWAVVFPEGALDALEQAAPAVYAEVKAGGTTWTPVDIRYRGTRYRINGNTFHGIARTVLLRILQRAAAEAGASLQFGYPIADLAGHRDADLVVGADGVNSVVRNAAPEVFRPTVERSRFRHAWFGVDRVFHDFTYLFQETPWGLFRAYCYPSGQNWSSFIVHLPEDVWERSGLSGMDDKESARLCQQVFADSLTGGTVLSSGATWALFPHLSCATWHHGRTVLVGDAAHTAHWSIGSGTRLAIEDAIVLAERLRALPGEVPAALAGYEAIRRPRVARFQQASRLSERYFENIGRYRDFPPTQLAYQLMARSWRVTHRDIARRDPAFVTRFDGWFHSQATGREVDLAPSPAFAPLRAPGLTLANRVVTLDDARGSGLTIRELPPAGRPEPVDATEPARVVGLLTPPSGDLADLAHRARAAGYATVLLDLTGTPAHDLVDGAGLRQLAALRGHWPAALPVGVALQVGPADADTEWADLVRVATSARADGVELVLLRPAATDAPAVAREVAVRVVQAADAVRNQVGSTVVAAGATGTINEIDTIVAAGWADLCVLTPGPDPMKEA